MRKTERRKDNKTISLIQQVSKIVGKEVSKKNFPLPLGEGQRVRVNSCFNPHPSLRATFSQGEKGNKSAVTLAETSEHLTPLVKRIVSRARNGQGVEPCRAVAFIANKQAGGSEGGITNNKFPRPLRERVRVRGQKAAFTLAEVLITLGVIGVVAAITLPSFIGNHQAKVRTEQNRMVQYKLTKATDLMKSHGKIGNYSTTKDFVNELKKYFKIAQVCENDNLEQCWPTKVIATDGTEVKVSDIKNGKNLNPDGWTKDTLGIITADGTPMIITYKDDCPGLDQMKTYTWTTEDNKPVTNATASCIAAIYDLNGKSRPNKSGEDVRLFHASTLAGKIQDNCFDGVCLSITDAPITPVSKSDCENDTFGLGTQDLTCPYDGDYWLGAMKACKDAGGRLPTMAELVKVASKVYNNDSMTGPTTNYDNLTYDTSNKFSIPSGVYLWSSEVVPSNKNRAYVRYFYSSSSFYNYNGRNLSSPRARCVGGS